MNNEPLVPIKELKELSRIVMAIEAASEGVSRDEIIEGMAFVAKNAPLRHFGDTPPDWYLDYLAYKLKEYMKTL